MTIELFPGDGGDTPEGASIAEALEALKCLEIVRRNDGYIPSSYHRTIRSALERAARVEKLNNGEE